MFLKVPKLDRGKTEGVSWVGDAPMDLREHSPFNRHFSFTQSQVSDKKRQLQKPTHQSTLNYPYTQGPTSRRRSRRGPAAAVLPLGHAPAAEPPGRAVRVGPPEPPGLALPRERPLSATLRSQRPELPCREAHFRPSRPTSAPPPAVSRSDGGEQSLGLLRPVCLNFWTGRAVYWKVMPET